MKKEFTINEVLINYKKNIKYKLLSFRIVYLSAFYRFMILCLPKKKLKKFLGASGIESAPTDSFYNQKKAFWYGRHIDKICSKTPWEAKCLVRAMTAQRLLKIKGIHSTLYLGIAREDGEIIAHAWIRCGNLYVTGGNCAQYTTVAKFCK